MARLDIAVSVLGAGSMGGAIASGLVSAGMVDATRVSVCDLREEVLVPFGAQGMTCLTSADELVAQDGYYASLVKLQMGEDAVIRSEVASLAKESYAEHAGAMAEGMAKSYHTGKIEDQDGKGEEQ